VLLTTTATAAAVKDFTLTMCFAFSQRGHEGGLASLNEAKVLRKSLSGS
jgi:hypothetical protein